MKKLLDDVDVKIAKKAVGMLVTQVRARMDAAAGEKGGNGTSEASEVGTQPEGRQGGCEEGYKCCAPGRRWTNPPRMAVPSCVFNAEIVPGYIPFWNSIRKAFGSTGACAEFATNEKEKGLWTRWDRSPNAIFKKAGCSQTKHLFWHRNPNDRMTFVPFPITEVAKAREKPIALRSKAMDKLSFLGRKFEDGWKAAWAWVRRTWASFKKWVQGVKERAKECAKELDLACRKVAVDVTAFADKQMVRADAERRKCGRNDLTCAVIDIWAQAQEVVIDLKAKAQKDDIEEDHR
uniref:Uncharacterized protein n=1 Tax=Zooxanthella nutricula TaxID=1333877 RepID=A0A6U6WXB2_9DINO|mmetsp:Transcript_95331/g.291535  ORF Transcript_95331/g.291535 Transcript_95331/m.291535 type:complete len:291 (+) Transcript_95331:329-1201(+)